MNQSEAAPDAAAETALDAAYEAKLRADYDGQSREDVLRDYREMLRIRRFEEAAARAYTRGKISGFLHLYIGQEAIAVATQQVMQPGDRVVATYRTHGFAIALGSEPSACAAELFGKATGLRRRHRRVDALLRQASAACGAATRSSAITSRSPPAARSPRSTPATARHARASWATAPSASAPCTRASTMAGIMKLPIVFVVENNQYSMGTPLKRTLPVEDITARAAGYGFASDRFHVTSVQETRRRLAEAVERARKDRRADAGRAHHLPLPRPQR